MIWFVLNRTLEVGNVEKHYFCLRFRIFIFVIRKDLFPSRANDEEERYNNQERDIQSANDASSHYSQASGRSHPSAPKDPGYDHPEYTHESTEVPIVEVKPPVELAENEDPEEKEQPVTCDTSPPNLNDDKLEVPSIGPDAGTHSYASALEVHHYKDLDAISSASFQF